MRILRALPIGVAVIVPAIMVTAVPAAAQTASVTVNATAGLGTVPAHAIGLNTAVYDGNMNNSAIPPLLKAAGIDALRYPGGSYSDIYNWQNQTAAAGGYVAPNTSFSNFMSTVNAAGAATIITVTTALARPASRPPGSRPRPATTSSTGRSATRPPATAPTAPIGRRTRTARRR